ncbi:hypothetical protein B5M45_27055 [Mycobacterium simiae]|uniref:Uncharacterized protein n=1 Tax=Mycobacterium simiae TaxID=1784 RepID=A0A1X0XN00_MYCSI|nr:hypothetical protein B5M45_27055 [Mycobacterium simiae]
MYLLKDVGSIGENVPSDHRTLGWADPPAWPAKVCCAITGFGVEDLGPVPYQWPVWPRQQVKQQGCEMPDFS